MDFEFVSARWDVIDGTAGTFKHLLQNRSQHSFSSVLGETYFTVLAQYVEPCYVKINASNSPVFVDARSRRQNRCWSVLVYYWQPRVGSIAQSYNTSQRNKWDDFVTVQYWKTPTAIASFLVLRTSTGTYTTRSSCFTNPNSCLEAVRSKKLNVKHPCQ